MLAHQNSISRMSLPPILNVARHFVCVNSTTLKIFQTFEKFARVGVMAHPTRTPGKGCKEMRSTRQRSGLPSVFNSEQQGHLHQHLRYRQSTNVSAHGDESPGGKDRRSLGAEILMNS
jgi:hypothetical protein